MDINNNPEDEEYVKIETSLDENELKKLKTQTPKEDQDLGKNQETKKDNQLLTSQLSDHKENNLIQPNINIVEQTRETLNNLLSLRKINIPENIIKKNFNENFEIKNEKDNSLILNLNSTNIIKNDNDNFKYSATNYLNNENNNELNEIEKNNKNEQNEKENKLDKNLDEIKNLNEKIIRDKNIITNINNNFSFGNKDNSTDRIIDQNENNNSLNTESISNRSLHRKCKSKSNIKKIDSCGFYFNYKNEDFFNNLNIKHKHHERKTVIDDINNKIKYDIDNNIKNNFYSKINNGFNSNTKTNVNSTNLNIDVKADINTNNNDMDNEIDNNINTNINTNIYKNSYTNINLNKKNIYTEENLLNIENLNIDDEKNINNNDGYFPSKKLIGEENINMNDKNYDINNNEEETILQKSNNFTNKMSSINTSNSSILDSLSIKRADEEEKNMRIQIEDEERKLYELEKEKQKLLEEEKERRKIILNAIAKQKQNKKKAKSLIKKNKLENEKKLRNIYIQQEKNKSEIQKLLTNRLKDEEKLMLIEEKENQYNNKIYDSNLNENYIDKYLKKAEQENKLSNQKNVDVFRNTYTNMTHNYHQSSNKNSFYENTNDYKKYNLTSYFQYKHSPKKNNKSKSYYNLSDDGLSSINDDTNKLSNINSESNTSSIPLTPNMNYRSNKSCDKKYNVVSNSNSNSHARLYQRKILLPEEEIRIQQYEKEKKNEKFNENDNSYLKTLNYDNANKTYINSFSEIPEKSSKIGEFQLKNIQSSKNNTKANIFNTKDNYENIDKDYFTYTKNQNNIYENDLFSDNNFSSTYANSHFHNNSTTKLNIKHEKLYSNFQDDINQNNNYMEINNNTNNNEKNFNYQEFQNNHNNKKSSVFMNKICSPVIIGKKYDYGNPLKINLNEKYIPWYNCDGNVAICENCKNERNSHHGNENHKKRKNTNGKYSYGNDVLKLCPYCKELYRKSKTDLE